MKLRWVTPRLCAWAGRLSTEGRSGGRYSYLVGSHQPFFEAAQEGR